MIYLIYLIYHIHVRIITEDVFQFKRDIDESIAKLAKINSRKKEIQDINHKFYQLLELHFEGVFPTAEVLNKKKDGGGASSSSSSFNMDEEVATGQQRKRGRVSTGSEEESASTNKATSASKPEPKKKEC